MLCCSITWIRIRGMLRGEILHLRECEREYTHHAAQYAAISELEQEVYYIHEDLSLQWMPARLAVSE